MNLDDPGQETRALQHFKDGDRGALDDFWPAYYRRLVDHAANHGFQLTPADGDESDVVVSAFRTFFRRANLGDFPKLDNREDLWMVLMMLVNQKVCDTIRRARRRKRGGDWGIVRESSLAGDDGTGFEGIGGREFDPFKSAEMRDLMNHLMGQIQDEKSRSIIELKKEGLTNGEIAQRLGIAEVTVYRKLERIRDIWAPTLKEPVEGLDRDD
jgi:RNA polymerase sigma factor (sigma-70 family)